MPIQYTPSKYAYYTSDEILVEQEHAVECDANVIIKRAANGQSVRTRVPGPYGYDDTTLDGVQHRIIKEQLKEELDETLEQEFDEQDAEKIKSALPENYAKKVKIKRKQDPDLSKSMESVVQSPKQIGDSNEQRPNHQTIIKPS